MNKLLSDYAKKPIVPSGVVNGVMGVNLDDDYSSTESEDDEYEQYEQDYSTEDLCDVDGVDGIYPKNNAYDVYANYNFTTTTFIKKELPIDSFKQKIIHLVDVNNVVIIQGPTGCGKTTQVPQYVLDEARDKKQYCNIAVTQPRKIATINVARRVCEERGWTLGTVCGYQLILMSATIEAEEFAHYFRCQNLTTSLPAPIIYVNKKSCYTKTVFYIEQFGSTLDAKTKAAIPKFEIDKPEISEGVWKIFVFLVSVIDKLDAKDPVTNQPIIGSVLVFLPGINEIEEANRRLTKHFKEERQKKLFTEEPNKEDNGTDGKPDGSGEKPKKAPLIKWEIIPLHSSLPNDEQAKVFRPPATGYRKVILSTNIAESSITVPDSYYVIDFCQTKVMTVDPVTKYMSLKLEWASHVNCEQRAGRVGRIGNAAGCSIQNIFSIPFQQRFNAYKKLLLWADGSSSDLIALLNLFQVWQSYKRENHFENWQAEHRWCSLNLVSLKGLKEWNLLVTEMKQRLEHLNIKATTGPGRVVLSHVEKPLILKIITAGAFYPNFFVKVPDEIQLDEREAVKVVGGRDPSRTVYFTGMDPSQPGPLYIRAIKDMLKNENDSESDVVVGFDGSSKIYVEFKSFNRKSEQVAVSVNGFQRVTNAVPGKIPIEVYEAIRKRQLNYIFSLKLLPAQEAWIWAEKNGIKRNTTLQTLTASLANEERNCYSEMEYSPIPSLDIEWITLKITEVLFIDYGNIQQVKAKDIYYLPPDRAECNLAPLGIECFLHGIQPSLKENPKGVWADKVNNYWMRQTAGVLLYGKVHSVVDDVLYLELFKNQPNNRQIKSVNQQMLEQGFAEPSSESFLSRADHEKRQQVQKAENPNLEAVRLSFDKVINYQDFEAPKIGENCKSIQLKGPYNPLEMKIYGSIASAANKTVDIDGSSVNTVLLDNESRNFHTSLLVAGYVGQTGNGARLRLRQTSMLPSIPGLPMLLSLLFCPTMRVKLTEDGTRVASILCGLGYNEYTNKPYYPSHDLTLILDTELTEDEVNKVSRDGCVINQIRFYMNQGVKLMYEISQEMSGQEEMIRTQNCLKKELIE
ncbi:hypothetical protein NQ314_012217 [Rhamnusium bicolor]|uniref:Probable ATP-dependent RNA helicase spindle-E n=1 Tax=Rhamnusium bicolor TaxID=1586634 RepID=A0AAV8XC59_9CUCU|nr:hypothetical protein NQ314_012217 [Rhamnusium bicolor]